ncbi:hypothetical protein ACFWDP_38165, partial [Streptomyces anthocyanicus]
MSSPQYETYGPSVNPTPAHGHTGHGGHGDPEPYGHGHGQGHGHGHPDTYRPAYEHEHVPAPVYGNRHGPVYAYELEHEPAYGHEYGHGYVHPGEAWFPDAPTLPRQAVPLAPTAELTTDLTPGPASGLLAGPARPGG